MQSAIPLGLFIIGLACLIFFPQSLTAGTKNALEIFFNAVFPGLFPGLVLCRYCLPRLQFPTQGLIPRLFSRITRCPASLLGVWCTARFSGSPAGAAALSSALADQTVSPRQASYYALVFSGVSPAFMTVTVAASVLGLPQTGWILLAAHELGLVLTYRLWGRGMSAESLPALPQTAPPALGQVLSSSLFTLGQVGCLLILCSILWEWIRASGLVSGAPPVLQACLQGMLEMSRGCAASQVLPSKTAIVLCAYLTGFSGLCIALQCFAVLGDLPIHKGIYLAGKSVHGILCALIAYVLYTLAEPWIGLPAGAFPTDKAVIGVWEILSAVLTVLGYAIWGKRKGSY